MNKIALIILGIFFQTSSFSQIFEKYFDEGSLRIDYIHTANDKDELISLGAFYHEPYWGGSKVNLIDTFNYGHYKFEVYDSSGKTLIYSRGYSTICGEWRYTPEAKKLWRSFSETIIMPYPKNDIKVEIFKREKNQKWTKITSFDIDPNDYMIIPQLKTKLPFSKIHYSGHESQKLDIVILAEGYSKKEIKKFNEDAKRFSNYLLECKPFNKHKNDINIWAISSVSEESGTDIPGKGIYKNTFFDSHFYTFGIERYINTLNNKAVRNAAANVPYDQIYILINTNKYGGAGIYNYYSTCTADHNFSNFVFTHEFGHAFAGLADEYYSSEVATESFYDLNSEPWEPNITTLVDFNKKWKSMLSDSVQIPTPISFKNVDSLGVFEGAGYEKKGIYRPRQECSMKSVRYDYFCPVCSKAISDMIKFYAQ